MGARYMVSGVQLGMLRALSEHGDTQGIEDLLNQVIQKQHLKDSCETVEKDAETVRGFIKEVT